MGNHKGTNASVGLVGSGLSYNEQIVKNQKISETEIEQIEEYVDNKNDQTGTGVFGLILGAILIIFLLTVILSLLR